MDWTEYVGKRVQTAIEIWWDAHDGKRRKREGAMGVITKANGNHIRIDWDEGGWAWLPTDDEGKLAWALRIEGDSPVLDVVRTWTRAMIDNANS